MENLFHHYNHQSHLMKDLKLLQYHFLFHLLTYRLKNQTILHSKLFYIDFTLNQNIFKIPLRFLLKNVKWFLSHPQ